MIQANELRIGNWVISFMGNYQRINKAIEIDYLLEEQPIPLTPEILEKAGFINSGRYALGKAGYLIYNDEFNNRIEFMQKDKSEPFVLAFYETKLKYLHQLQNLYFALTGEELQCDL